MSTRPKRRRINAESPTSEGGYAEVNGILTGSKKSSVKGKEKEKEKSSQKSLNEVNERRREEQEEEQVIKELEEHNRIWDMLIENHSDSVNDLPLEVKRAFQLISDLEQKRAKEEETLHRDLLRLASFLDHRNSIPSSERKPIDFDDLLDASLDASSSTSKFESLGTGAITTGDEAFQSLVTAAVSLANASVSKSSEVEVSATVNSEILHPPVPIDAFLDASGSTSLDLMSVERGVVLPLEVVDASGEKKEVALSIDDSKVEIDEHQDVEIFVDDKNDRTKENETADAHIFPLDPNIVHPPALASSCTNSASPFPVPTVALTRTSTSTSIPSSVTLRVLLQGIARSSRLLVRFSEDKLVLERGVQQSVDRCLQRLGDDIERLATGRPPRTNGKTVVRAGPRRREKEKKSGTNGSAREVKVEVLYCYCRKESFGGMVACERVGCPNEWYHLECVGLDEAPHGDWYCPTCIEEIEKKNQKVTPSTIRKRKR